MIWCAFLAEHFLAAPSVVGQKARCFSLFTQLAEAQAHIQALEVTVKSLQAMNDLMSYIVLPQYRATARDKTPSLHRREDGMCHKSARAAARREM